MQPTTGIDRRRFVSAVGATVLSSLAGTARAQVGAPLRFVVGFSAGGSTDTIARLLAKEFVQAFSRSTVVENVPGANSAKAIARVASGKPPGDFLLMATSSIAHPDNREGSAGLQPVIVTSTSPLVLVVRSSLPVQDPREFERYARSHPGLSYGSGGVGNATHLCSAELMERLGVEAIHVPYQGSTPALADLLGGRIDFMSIGASGAGAHLAGVRLLAVSTASRSRLPGFDHLPTISESIAPGFDFPLWQGIWTSAQVSGASIATLNGQFRALLDTASVRKGLADLGAEVVSGSPQDAQRRFEIEVAHFRALGRH